MKKVDLETLGLYMVLVLATVVFCTIAGTEIRDAYVQITEELGRNIR